MDPRSESNLVKVHPDLVRVMRRAYVTTKQPFVIIDGLRTPDEEKANVAKSVSQTLHSRHLPNKEGLACAVDVAATTGGKIVWEAMVYQPIAAAVLQAAHDENVVVEWGGSWKTLKDWGHFQLPWSAYP